MHDHGHSHDHQHGHQHGHDHAEGHDHSHVPQVTTQNERKVLLAFVITFAFMLVEAVGGYLSGSLALLADAGHMLTDAGALALSYLAFRFGRRAADQRRSFGYLRLEVVAAFVNALTLFAIVLWIAYEAWHRLTLPPQILAGPMLAIAVTGLLVNLLVLWILNRGDTDHVNIQGATLHVLGDLLGSVGAIVAALVIWLTGWTLIDPILSLLVAVLILRSAWFLGKRSLNILLEGAPAHVQPAQIDQHVRETFADEVRHVGHIHVWQITDRRVLATLHVGPSASARIEDLGLRIAASLRQRFQIEHSTVALEFSHGAMACSLSAKPEKG